VTAVTDTFPVDRLRADFPAAERQVYFNTAAESLFLASNMDALARYAEAKSWGSVGRQACIEVEEHCRSLVAQMIGVKAADIAFVASTARALDAVIGSVNWRQGDNMVITDAEFPSTTYAGTRLERLGVELRVVRSVDGKVAPERFADSVDRRSRLVAVSAVSYKTGFRADLAAIAAVVHDQGSLLFVDAIQGVGVVPIDARPVDFLSFGTYKWQLGAHGIAAFYVNPATVADVEPPYVAYRSVANLFPSDPGEPYRLWPDARRFEEGMPNFSGMFVMENALGYLLGLGVERIAAYVGGLVDLVMDKLDNLGVRTLTSHNRHARAGIVAFESPNAARLVAGLAEDQVHLWGRDGRLRISSFLYNSAEEVEFMFERLEHFSAVQGISLQ
jgi:cysteine desulfurase / selenocysteine lyase